MLQLMEERDGNSCDPLPGEMEAMLDNRNKAWVEKMPAIMTEAPYPFRSRRRTPARRQWSVEPSEATRIHYRSHEINPLTILSNNF